MHRARIPVTCGDRLCRDCASHTEKLHRAKLRALVQHEAETNGRFQDLRSIVLTVRNAPIGQLSRRRKELVASFRRLRQTKDWKRRVESWSSSEEVTGSVARGWHPHLNVVVVGSYWDQRELAKLWTKVTRGVGSVVWIRALVRGAPTRAAIESGIQEAVKYLVKSEEVKAAWNDAMKKEFRKAYRKVRIFAVGGRWRGLVLADIDALARPEGELTAGPRRGNCPECGADHFDWTPAGRPLSLFDAQALGYRPFFSYDPTVPPPPPLEELKRAVDPQAFGYFAEDLELRGIFREDTRFHRPRARRRHRRGCLNPSCKCRTTKVSN